MKRCWSKLFVVRNGHRVRAGPVARLGQQRLGNTNGGIRCAACNSTSSKAENQARPSTLNLSQSPSVARKPENGSTKVASPIIRESLEPVITSPPIGNLAIVFTDIVKSTVLWETVPEAMRKAMALHDSIVRRAAKSLSGYEVKTNGDGFMLAFSSPLKALMLCLKVQKELIGKEGEADRDSEGDGSWTWPVEILENDVAKEVKDRDGKIIFRGLGVRMSIHWGAPVCVWNEVTKRMDYIGPMVNRSARCIEVTEGGQVVVSEEFLDALEEERNLRARNGSSEEGCGEENRLGPSHGDDDPDQPSLPWSQEDFEIRPLGEHDLKGLSDPMKLFYIVPTSLQGRVEHYHQKSEAEALGEDKE